MHYEMIDDKVLIKLNETGEIQTSGGIVLPESAQAVKNEGTVVSIGKGKKVFGEAIITERMTVKVGDVVVFVPERCVSLELDGADHVVIRETDILAVQRP